MQNKLNIEIANLVFGGPEKVRFTCPSCNGRWFSTHLAMAICHDEFGVGCRWRGSREDSVFDFASNIKESIYLLMEFKEIPSFEIKYYRDKPFTVIIGKISATGDTLSEAICSAIVRFVESENIA
jgi:hypothetical protein